ncbi:hypothetical protein BKA70DRAFT_57124 [Coprinopsis sp. MPI-PUGE-AT-0042]|nr:hypothetical protein BKA70DRAFT_57124 [Coprinopsis sp. MPI-PUGE-AT-0042]
MPPKKSPNATEKEALEGHKDEGTGRRRTRLTTQKKTDASTSKTQQVAGKRKSAAQKKKELLASDAPKESSCGKATSTGGLESHGTPETIEGPSTVSQESEDPPKVQKKRARAKEGAAATATAKENGRVTRKKIEELEAQVHGEWLAVQHEDDLLVARERTQAVKRLSDIPKLRRGHSDSTGETDGEVIDVAVSEDEGDGESEPEAEAAADRQERIRRLKAEIDALKKGAGKSRGKGKGKPNDGGVLPLASGLKPDFLAAKQKAPANLRVHESVGLDDDDIEDSPPADGHVQAKPLPRGSQRVNSMVTALAELDVGPRTTVQPPKTKVKHLVDERSQANTERSAETQAPKESVALRRPKASKRVQELVLAPASSSDTPLASGSKVPPNVDHAAELLASTVRVSNLPEFAHLNQDWKLKFLPTLYLIFYTSFDTFKGFALSSRPLLNIVQAAVNTVYPKATYRVRIKGEPFYLLAYNRINDRRARISNLALERLSTHLKGFRLTSEAHDFLMWARRLDGPLFFKEPTPASCKASRDEPGYVPPSGRLRSPFVVDLVRDALSHSKNALYVPNVTSGASYPIGLFALVMISLERAASVLDADGAIPQKMKKFSEENYGAQLKTYVGAMNAITADQWDEILQEYDVASEDTDQAGNASVADNDRLNIFSFESPKKCY